MKIEPTIGRVVWYYPSYVGEPPKEREHLAAIVSDVLDNGHINIAGFRSNGQAFYDQDIRLVQDGEETPATAHYCTWMPYQVGQAKKAEAETDAFFKAAPFPATHEYAQIGNTVSITSTPLPTVKDIDDDTIKGLIKAVALDNGNRDRTFPVHLERGCIWVNKDVLEAEAFRRQQVKEREAKASAPEGVTLSLREKEVFQWAWNKLNEDPSSQYGNVRDRLSILHGIMNKCLDIIPGRDEAKAEDPALVKEQLTQAAEDWRSEAERLRAVLQEIAGATPLSTVNGLKMLADRALNPVKWRGRDQHQPTFSESVFNESSTPADVDAVRTLMRKAENYDRVMKWLDEVNAATHEFKDGDARELSLIQRIESGIARAAKQETPTASYETQDPKYNIVDCKLVNASTGKPIPHDEPIFIFRAQDMLSVAVLGYYISIVTNSDHKGIVSLRLKQFCTFANEHRDRMKYPDTDPALAAVTVERGGSGAFKFHVGPLDVTKPVEAEQPAIPEGFTPWTGGVCPVNQNDVVDIVLRRGNTLYNNVAGNLCWLNDDVFSESSHIIGYKVTFPAPVSATTDDNVFCGDGPAPTIKDMSDLSLMLALSTISAGDVDPPIDIVSNGKKVRTSSKEIEDERARRKAEHDALCHSGGGNSPGLAAFNVVGDGTCDSGLGHVEAFKAKYLTTGTVGDTVDNEEEVTANLMGLATDDIKGALLHHDHKIDKYKFFYTFNLSEYGNDSRKPLTMYVNKAMLKRELHRRGLNT